MNIMTPETIRTTFRNIFNSPFLGDKLRVSWHSGEPLVLKPSYYRDAIRIILEECQSSPRSDLIVDFDFQTNATLINNEWIAFFREFDGVVTLGISCDGPSSLHDLYRRNWSGKPTHAATEAGMHALCAAGIPFDITAVVSPGGLEQPEEFMAYFEQFQENIREFHFNLHDELFIAPDDKRAITEYSQKYEKFLTTLLEITSCSKYQLPKIRNFSSFYNRIFVEEANRPQYDARSMCAPFKSISIEIDGSLTTFYAGLTLDECRDLKNIYGDNKGFVVGNALHESLAIIAGSEKLKRIEKDFESSHSACEQSCEFYELCSGGYNLIKHRRHGRFDATETPECRIHVKTFANTLLNHLDTELVVDDASC